MWLGNWQHSTWCHWVDWAVKPQHKQTQINIIAPDKVIFFQPKIIDIFLLLHKKIGCEYSLEVPHRSISKEYHNIFSWRNKKKLYLSKYSPYLNLWIFFLFHFFFFFFFLEEEEEQVKYWHVLMVSWIFSVCLCYEHPVSHDNSNLTVNLWIIFFTVKVMKLVCFLVWKSCKFNSHWHWTNFRIGFMIFIRCLICKNRLIPFIDERI